MANGFGSLFIGASGLRNAQTALNTTANNMSNVDTTGYVRQQVRFADMDYNLIRQPRANVNLQQTGLGVSIGDVVHARDIFLDKIYRQESGRRDFYSVRFETTDYTIDLLQELDGEQFKESVNDLWQAFQELSTHTAESIYQNLTLQKAELLVSRSQALYRNLQNYQSNINGQIKDDVEEINKIGNRIYELNLAIQKVEAGGIETAMTLRDERDNLLDKLGTYGNIDVTEDATGFAYVDFESTRFVDDFKCFNIGLSEDNGTGFYTPYWPHLTAVGHDPVPVYSTKIMKSFDSETNTDIGTLKSKLMVRGDFYGRSEDLEEPNYTGKNIAYCTLMKVEAQIDYLFGSIAKSMNDIFCPNKALENDVMDATGTTVLIPKGTLVLDEENCPVGVDGQLPPKELFVRAGCSRYTEVPVNGKTYYVYNEEIWDDPLTQTIDESVPSTHYMIGNVVINEELKKQITLMPAYVNDGVFNQVAYDMGAKLAAAWEAQGMKLNPYDAKPCNFEQYYNRIIGELGVEGNIYKAATDTLDDAVASVDNKRLMVTGVSSDEELTHMIKYQAAYNAASRFITVISQMTELIVTGLK